MRNLKALSLGNNLAIESGLSMTAPAIESENENNENIFLIGLNFQGETEIFAGNNNALQNTKIPVFMLKIDTDKLLSKMNASKKIPDNEHGEEYEENGNSKNTYPVAGVISYQYGTGDEKPIHENLSYREMQVLKLIALGKTRKEIADQLFLSISTINTYRARILEKMNMKNNADLMRYAFKQRLVK